MSIDSVKVSVLKIEKRQLIVLSKETLFFSLFFQGSSVQESPSSSTRDILSLIKPSVPVNFSKIQNLFH